MVSFPHSRAVFLLRWVVFLPLASRLSPWASPHSRALYSRALFLSRWVTLLSPLASCLSPLAPRLGPRPALVPASCRLSPHSSLTPTSLARSWVLFPSHSHSCLHQPPSRCTKASQGAPTGKTCQKTAIAEAMDEASSAAVCHDNAYGWDRLGFNRPPSAAAHRAFKGQSDARGKKGHNGLGAPLSSLVPSRFRY